MGISIKKTNIVTRYTAKHIQYLVTVTHVQLNLLAMVACEAPCWIISTALSLSTAVKRGIFLCAFSSCGTNVSVQPFYTVDLHVRTVLQTVPCFSRGARFFPEISEFFRLSWWQTLYLGRGIRKHVFLCLGDRFAHKHSDISLVSFLLHISLV